ncbi:SNARE associated protein [Clostridium sp. DL-VIII]|uniref:TVP38/TMEM64 family protein n=1 Tax=Clostridium sp. DL-VIII TaxID=641107 RepID=UPI00023AFC77|nr:VTT domain-containing protein [Clostridium sp. DL-VIII]EHJ00182.1 SNARE associated protein [Clostridium sp. DL-VIII]
MDKLFKIIVLIFWVAILFLFFKYKLYVDGVDKVINFLNTYREYSVLLFLIIASLRIFTLIPCTVFIIIGGVLFNPFEAFLLTAAANLISEILLFFFAKLTFGMSYQNKIIEKHPKIYNMIKKNNVQILALGVSSPVVPSDIVCFFSVLAEITLLKYIITILLADTPVILLYTFLGISAKYSIYVFLFMLILVIVINFINFKKWNNQIAE